MNSMTPDRGRLFGRHNWPILITGGLVVLLLALRSGDIFAGTLPDNDDMMRMQQVRDLMAGQNWFNVDQSRFLTPEGGQMHWSRLPDLFLSAVIFVTRPFIGQAHAESLAAVMWPMGLLTVLLASLTLVMRRLNIGTAGQIAGLVFFSLSAAVYNFWPGRIDHHNLVVVLTVIGLAATLSPRSSARSAIIAAACITAMLSVAVESLPYVGALILSFGLIWIVRGHRESSRLAVFGIALSGFAAVFYLLDAPGIGMRRAVCDAYGTSHLAGLVGGGVILAALGALGGGLDNWLKRLIAGAVSGIVILALVVWVNPACLGDPYASVSEQVKLAWLSAVGEARSLPTVWASEPARIVWQFGFIAAGLVACAIMMATATEGRRVACAILGLMVVLSALATVWQIRGVTFSHVFAAIAGGWLFGVLFERWWAQRGAGPVLMLALGALLVSPTSWRMLSTPFEKPSITSADGRGYGVTCRDPEAYIAIRDHEIMDIFTPIDLGTSVLLRTPHRIFAGPYHRNVQGIDLVTDVFMGSPDTARAKIEAMGADHVLYCRGLIETVRYAKLRPEGFAAQLEAGQIPAWLTPVDAQTETDGVARLYKVATE